MDVIDGLASVSATVEDQTITVVREAEIPGDLCGGQEQFSRQSAVGVREIIDRRHMTTRDDQDMVGGLWMEVLEGIPGIPLGDSPALDGPPNDLAEETFH